MLLDLSAEYSFATIMLEDSVKVGESPTKIDADINANKVYVTNYRSDSVSVIDGATNKVLNTIELEQQPFDIAIDKNTNMVVNLRKKVNS